MDGKPLLKPCKLAEAAKKTVHMKRPLERIDAVFLGTLDPSEATQGYGTLQKNHAILETPVMIAGRQYWRGLGTHSPSRSVYPLDSRFRKFEAWADAKLLR